MDYTRLASSDDPGAVFARQGLFSQAQDSYLHLSFDVPQHVLLATALAAVLLAVIFVRQLLPSPAYLLDLHCFQPPERLKVNHKDLFLRMREKKAFSEQAILFQEKILERSGLGEESYFSDGIMRLQTELTDATHQECLDESNMVLFDCVANLLEKTGTQPHEVDAVLVSCSCFAPTPSMAATLVNRFKFREDVMTYNLSGMGCSSSLVCVDMAKHLLKAMPEKLILIVNHENITRCRYSGEDRSMLVVNMLFRVGGAAVLMSNRAADASRAKYTLRHTVRTHMGANDEAFGCMGAKEDEAGLPGVFLQTCVVKVAGLALARNLKRLGNLVLPLTEKVASLALVRNLKRLGNLVLPLTEKANHLRDRTYVPRFNACFEHYLMHTGGRGVLDALTKEPLSLSEKQLAASRATLHKFGNTSAASTWYVLARLEQDGLIKKGDRLWQLGFGGGFKANSAVWTARRNVQQDHSCWASS